MESPTRRRIDVPRPSAADTGLAEWTSRIKAIQRDVDADEELEQRRLEEEIRASRLARSRRSGGMQLAGRVSLPVGVGVGVGVGEEDEKASTPAEALRKLGGESPIPAPAPSIAPAPSTSHHHHNATQTQKPEPISLAAFIGGRATGPRLNRPAPQPDAHDPTLFEQRTRADIVAPHPVFGSGGVALAGLVGTGKGREVRAGPAAMGGTANAAHSGSAGSTLNVVTNNGGGAPPARSWARERTVSSPSPYMPPKPAAKSSPPPVIPAGSPGLKGRVESLYANANRSSERVTSPPVLRGSKSTDKMSQQHRPTAPVKPEALRKPQPAADTPSRASTMQFYLSISTPPPRALTPGSSTPTKPASVSPPIAVPSLARPIQPQQRPLSTGPHIPLSKNPAPAFLKPAQQKDLTPSLSRLQGRGFVQSFVKLTSEIEAASSGGSPERPVGAGASPKKGSVLDRWNPPSPSPSPGGSPVSAPPLRKAKTFDFTRSTQAEAAASPASKPTTVSEIVRPTPQPKPASLSLSTTASIKSTPTKAKSVPVPVPAPGDVLPLGSSNTLISYIKPTKTGDAPPTDGTATATAQQAHPRSKTPSRHADEDTGTDELGVRPKSRSSKTRSPSPAKAAAASRPSAKSDLASSVASSGRPLNHPTKDRAKLRRKGAGGQGALKSEGHQDPESAADESVVEQFGKQPVAPLLEVTPPNSKSETSPSLAALHREEPSKTPPPGQARGENIRRLQDTWSNQGPIGVKPLRKPPLVTPSPTRSSFGAFALPKVSKQALPGLAPPTTDSTAVPPPSPPLTPPLSVSVRQERGKAPSPSSPVRHGRIPSTGSRATVMDVAQAFNANSGSPVSPTIPKSPGGILAPPSRSPVALEEVRQRDPGGWNEAENERTITPAIIKAERRRSTYEKYANFTLPVLPEEKTPASSPVGTLKLGVDVSALSVRAGAGAVEEKENKPGSDVHASEKPVPPKKPDFVRAPSNSKVHIDIVDHEPVPAVNAAKIWDASPPRFVPDPDVHTVSVEVLSVAGGSATEVDKGVDNVYVFYDTETLVVVHRAKSRSSGLVATKVWAWNGRKAETGEREEKKMQELAKRFGTSLMKCGQCTEPHELVHILGGSLVVRQGKRSLWSSENTTMHVVRSLSGVILIDEVDLNVKNLCSGFSYCISLLDTLWVWYGCGSIPSERNAALRYAQTVSSNSEEKKVVEVEEGKEDEMFWMFLGEDGYASADYWKWRKSEKSADPRIWRIDCVNSGSEVKELETFPPPSEVSSSVLVVHLAYEIFTLVGSAARGRRRDIKLGLTLAQELSAHSACAKPFRPPVHVLIFPSQIPLDLRAAVRGLDADAIHESKEVPDHMNLLTLSNAWKQIQQKEWDEKELQDGSMMPLGLSPR